MKRNLAFCYEMFPALQPRRWQRAGSMSGGEQQRVALGRALMAKPRLLVVDEPSVGLTPRLVSKTMGAIGHFKSHRELSVLMAEQNFRQAVRFADCGYVMTHGDIVVSAQSIGGLRENDIVRNAYLGL